MERASQSILLATAGMAGMALYDMVRSMEPRSVSTRSCRIPRLPLLLRHGAFFSCETVHALPSFLIG